MRPTLLFFLFLFQSQHELTKPAHPSPSEPMWESIAHAIHVEGTLRPEELLKHLKRIRATLEVESAAITTESLKTNQEAISCSARKNIKTEV